MTAITLRNTRTLATLKALTNAAANVVQANAFAKMTSFPTKEAPLRRCRRVIEQHFTNDTSLDIAIPVTGLLHSVVSDLLQTYQTKVNVVNNTLDAQHPSRFVWITDPRVMTDKAQQKDYPVPTYIVFRIQLSADALASKANSHMVMNLLSQLFDLFDFEGTYEPSMKSTYPGANLYEYRGWPYSHCDEDQLWAVAGVDHLNGGSGILEWCCSFEDAQALISAMKHDYKRFSVMAEKQGAQAA